MLKPFWIKKIKKKKKLFTHKAHFGVQYFLYIVIEAFSHGVLVTERRKDEIISYERGFNLHGSVQSSAAGGREKRLFHTHRGAGTRQTAWHRICFFLLGRGNKEVDPMLKKTRKSPIYISGRQLSSV